LNLNFDQTLVVMPTIAGHASTYHAVADVLKNDGTLVLVVDNGEKAFVPAAVKTKASRDRIRVLRPGVNLNWLGSNNVGATFAKTLGFRYVCFLNDDVRLSDGFFHELRVVAATGPGAGMVVPRYNGFFGKEHQLLENTTSGSKTKISYCDGTCLFIPMEVFNEVGYLDPIFQQPGWGADVDYCYRLTAAGYSIYAADHARLDHYRQRGGKSAKIIYGSEKEWIKLGLEQVRRDLEKKYGSDWRNILPMPSNVYD